MIATFNAAASPARYTTLETSHDDMIYDDDTGSDMSDVEGTEELSANTVDNDKLNTRLLRIVKDNIVGAGLDG